MAERLGVGLVGHGAMATAVHARALRRIKGARLVAVADPDPRTRAGVRGAAAVASTDELLVRPDVEAVVVCAAPAAHAEVGLRVLASGRALYLEKPIATRLEDAERLVAAAAAGAQPAFTGFNRRYHPLFEHCRRLLRAGAVGEVRAVSTLFCEPQEPERMPAWKRARETGGGVLLDLAVHHVDLLRWIFEDEVEGVDAELRSTASEHDEAWVRARLASGVTAHLHASFRAGRVDALEFAGDRGTLRVDRYSRSLSVRLAPRGSFATTSRRVIPSRASLSWRTVALVRPGREPSYGRALRAFVQALQGRPTHLASLEDGLRALEVTAAAERSAAELVRPPVQEPV